MKSNLRYVTLVAVVSLLSFGCGGHVTPNPFIVVLNAQTLPQVVHAEWNKNAEPDVVDYLLSLDNGSNVVIANTIDTTCNCIKSGTFSINDTNTHTFSLRARNTLGLVSPTATFSFAIKVPSAPTGGTTKLGS